MKEPRPEFIDRDHPLRDEENIKRILLEGSDQELETLRKFHGFTQERVLEMRVQARSEERLRLEAEAKTMERELFGPPPAPEEIERGEFSEVAELDERRGQAVNRESKMARQFRRNAKAPHAYLATREELDDLLDGERKAVELLVQDLDAPQLSAVRAIARLGLGAEAADALKLVVCGLKPATTFSLKDDAPLEDQRRLQEALRGLGLSVLLRPRTEGDSFLAARDAETLERLKTASPAKDHEVYGKLMGFPPSAVAAYLSGEMLRTSPADIDLELVMPMRLSQAHWPEELKLAARWGYLLKKLDSRLDQTTPGRGHESSV